MLLEDLHLRQQEKVIPVLILVLMEDALREQKTGIPLYRAHKTVSNKYRFQNARKKRCF